MGILFSEDEVPLFSCGTGGICVTQGGMLLYSPSPIVCLPILADHEHVIKPYVFLEVEHFVAIIKYWWTFSAVSLDYAILCLIEQVSSCPCVLGWI